MKNSSNHLKPFPDMIETSLAIRQAIKSVVGKTGLPIDLQSVHLEHPSLEDHGDYSSNVALKLFVKFKRLNSDQNIKYLQTGEINTPKDLAEYIAQMLREEPSLLNIVSKLDIAGPGFINFWLKDEFYLSQIKNICKLGDDFGKNQTFSNQKIMVEYGHPNTHKEMHIGHMRTLITGESLARTLETCGSKVFRANYQGDIGPHVAKAIWGTTRLLQEQNLTWSQADKMTLIEKANLLGQGYVRGNQDYELHKTDINQINKSLYQSINKHHQHKPNDTDASQISLVEPFQVDNLYLAYQLTRQWSLDYFNQLYTRFGTHYDKLYFESQVADQGRQIVLDHLGKVFQESEGAVIFKGEKFGLHNRVFLTQEGNPTYEAKDLGLAPQQYKDFPFDKNIHVVGNEQDGYFKVVFKAMQMINPKLKDKEFHLSMGMVNIVGMKMSSRTGVLLKVNDLLEQVKEKLRKKINNPDLSPEQIEQVAEQGTVAAIKYSVLKTSPLQNTMFDIDKSVDIQGNSGPYLQYTHARCCSVMDKSAGTELNFFLNSQIELNPEEMDLVKALPKFKEEVILAGQEYAPNYICKYLHGVAQKYNTLYNIHSILSADTEDQKQLRLMITAATAQVIKKGLNLLGIQAPEKM